MRLFIGVHDRRKLDLILMPANVMFREWQKNRCILYLEACSAVFILHDALSNQTLM